MRSTRGDAATLLNDDWHAESVRVSFFVPAGPKPRSLLQEVVGQAPEQVGERPAQGLKQELISFHNGQLVINQAPGRVDLFYSAKPHPVTSTEPLVHVGTFRSALEITFKVGLALMKTLEPPVRMALAPIAIKQVSTEREAAEIIQLLVPQLPINPEMDRDIAWQINQRRRSSTFNGFINHISKLQSATTQLISVLVSSSNNPHPLEAVTVTFVRLELDINTPEDVSGDTFANRGEATYQELYSNTLRMFRGLPL